MATRDRGSLMLSAFNQTFSPMSRKEKQEYNMQRDFNVASNMHMNIEREELQLIDEARELGIKLDPANISGKTFLDIKKQLAVKRGGTEQEGLQEALRAMNAGGTSWVLGDGGRRTATNPRYNEDGNILVDVLTIDKETQRNLASRDELNDLTARRNPLTFSGQKTADGGREAVLNEDNIDKLYKAHSWNIKSKAGKQPSLAYLSGSEEILTILDNSDYLSTEQTDGQTSTMRGALDQLSDGDPGTLSQTSTTDVDTDQMLETMNPDEVEKVITEKVLKKMPKYGGLTVSGKAEDSGLRGDALYATLPLSKKEIDNLTIGGYQIPDGSNIRKLHQSIDGPSTLEGEKPWMLRGGYIPSDRIREGTLNPIQEKYNDYIDFSNGKDIPFWMVKEEWDSLKPSQKTDLKKKSVEVSNRNLRNKISEYSKDATRGSLDKPGSDEEQFIAQQVADFWGYGNTRRAKRSIEIRKAIIADPTLLTELQGIGGVEFAKKYMENGFPPPPEVDKTLVDDLKKETNRQPSGLKKAINEGSVDKISEFIKNNPGAYKVGTDTQGRIIMAIQANGGLARHYSKSDRAATVAGILSNMTNEQAQGWHGKLDSFVEYGTWDTGTSTTGLSAADFEKRLKEDRDYANEIRQATFQSDTYFGKPDDINLLNYASAWQNIDPNNEDFSKAAGAVQALTMLAKHQGPASMEQINFIHTKLIQGAIKGQTTTGFKGWLMSLPFIRGEPDNEAFSVDPNMVAVKKDGQLLTDPQDYKQVEYFIYRDAFNKGQRGKDVSASSFFSDVGADEQLVKSFATIAVMNLSIEDWNNNYKQSGATE